MKAYLSGAMEYEHDEGKGWRQEMDSWLTDNLGHTVFNPVTESELLISQHNAHDFRNWKFSNIDRFRIFVRNFVNQDIAAVKNECDYLICLWNKGAARGGGTHGEVTVAHDSQIPVYMVNEVNPTEISGWILACATEIFSSFDELKTFLSRKYA